MRISGLGVLATVALLGCGGSTRATDTRGGSGNNSDATDHISEGNGHNVDPNAPVSADECDAFTAHVIELNLIQMRKELPPEEVPTEEQVATIRGKLSADCLQFPRAVVECGTVATTIAAVAECQNKAPE